MLTGRTLNSRQPPSAGAGSTRPCPPSSRPATHLALRSQPLPPPGTLPPRKTRALRARAAHKSRRAMPPGVASRTAMPKSTSPLQASSATTSARGLAANGLSPQSVLTHLISFTDGRSVPGGDQGRWERAAWVIPSRMKDLCVFPWSNASAVSFLALLTE